MNKLTTKQLKELADELYTKIYICDFYSVQDEMKLKMASEELRKRGETR